MTTLPTLKACNSPYMQYYLKRFFVLHSSEVIFSFLIKKSRQKAIEIEVAFFSFSWESHGSHIELVEIFLKLSVKTVQLHLIVWMTLMPSEQFTTRRGIHSFYEKLVHKELVLNFLPFYNRNKIGYCSHNNREQKKNYETFSTETEARP